MDRGTFLARMGLGALAGLVPWRARSRDPVRASPAIKNVAISCEGWGRQYRTTWEIDIDGIETGIVVGERYTVRGVLGDDWSAFCTDPDRPYVCTNVEFGLSGGGATTHVTLLAA